MKYLLRPNCGKQKNPNPNYIPPATCKKHIADPGKMLSVTNADRIRAMSDQELADFFFESPEIEFKVCEYCEYFGGHTNDTPCKHDMGRCFVLAKNEAFKKWLQQPAEEG